MENDPDLDFLTIFSPSRIFATAEMNQVDAAIFGGACDDFFRNYGRFFRRFGPGRVMMTSHGDLENLSQAPMNIAAFP